MVECVVAYTMSVLYNLHILLWELVDIIAYHEEGRLYVVSSQQVYYPRGNDGYGSIVKGQIYRLLVRIHAP